MKSSTSRTGPIQRNLARELLLALGGSVLVLVAIFGTYLHLEQESIRAREIAAAQTSLGAARDALARELDLVRSHLHYLVGSQLAARFIEAGDAQAARRDLGFLLLAALGLVLPLAGYIATMRARQRNAERDLHLAGQVFDATGDAVIVTDSNFRIIRVNPAFTAITGWAFAEVAAQEPETLLSPSHTPPGTCTRIKDQLGSGGWQGMLWFRRAGGTEFPAFATVSQVSDGRRRMRNCVLVLNDRTDRVREEERVRMRAERDALTGLPNRRLLDDRLEQSIARARRSDKKLAVLFIDLERLKEVNDDGGHDAGDTVLQASAHRLTAALRVTDTAARVGGDEFVVVLDEVADRAAAQAVARKIASALEQPVEFAGHAYSIGASIGIKLFPEDGDSASALPRAADAEMHAVKARRHAVREQAVA